MGIYDDKVEQIDLKGQLKPFNINQLNRVMHILGQRRLGLDTSSIPTDEIPEDSHTGQSSKRMEYPSTPKQFNLFQGYKNVEHDGNMLTAEQRTRVYEDRSKVIAEMANAFCIFSRSIFTQRWLSSTISAMTSTLIILHRLCATFTYSCRRIS